MEYKHTSSDKELKANEPPMYATKIEGRHPELKYQRKGHARTALLSKMGKKHHYDGDYTVYKDMYLFKWIGDNYDLIWDGHSELADACRRGEMTPKEMLDRIEW